MSPLIAVQKVADVWTISLARPEKRNALSAGIVDELLDVVARAPTEGARILAFRGEGKCFSAGFDFSEVEQQSEGDLLLRFVRIEQLLQAVAASPCMTVALVHGLNFGAGVDLAAVCRLRVATADATFRMPGLKFGLVLGTRRFGDIVGHERASHILQRAGTFDARASLQMGFIHQIAEEAQWNDIVASARTEASILSDAMRATLYRTLDPDRSDSDLSQLVRSAATPGLKNRNAQYLKAG